MKARTEAFRARLKTPGGQKAIRYSLVSLISVAVAAVSLFVLVGFFHVEEARANIIASIIGGIPSYYLNRRWAWGKTGRSHLMKEVVPFWTAALVGLVFSTLAADWSGAFARGVTDVHLIRTLIVVAGALTAYGVLWIGKFIFFNKVVFVHREPAPARESTPAAR